LALLPRLIEKEGGTEREGGKRPAGGPSTEEKWGVVCQKFVQKRRKKGRDGEGGKKKARLKETQPEVSPRLRHERGKGSSS